MNDNKEEKTRIGQELCRQLTHEYTTLLEASPTAILTLKRDERNWMQQLLLTDEEERVSGSDGDPVPTRPHKELPRCSPMPVST